MLERWIAGARYCAAPPRSGYVPPLPMKSTHHIHIGDARDLRSVPDTSVQLVVTSPPYPMVEMWDHSFGELEPEALSLLEAGQGMAAFEAQHRVLDTVWAECARVLMPGCFLCINIGDATRSIAGEFCLYPNQSRIVAACLRLGLTPLPDILWRKPTNAPNKFMGSGMLPAGAYVTYEHEYILIFRKGGKRIFSEEEHVRRRASAYFWEERNLWFSDLWTDLVGTGQKMRGPRERSAAFPFELPFRLIQMYSLQGDTVLDPFVGTGTTMAAALATGRSSIGVERLPELRPQVLDRLRTAFTEAPDLATARLRAHAEAIRSREAQGKECKHRSLPYGFPVLTSQETELQLWIPERWEERADHVEVHHSPARWEG